MIYHANIEARINYPLSFELDPGEDPIEALKEWHEENKDILPWSPKLQSPFLEVRYSAHPSAFTDGHVEGEKSVKEAIDAAQKTGGPGNPTLTIL